MTRLIPATLLALLPFAAQAHGGHGLGGSHWHASDALGFALVIALGLGALWFGRNK